MDIARWIVLILFFNALVIALVAVLYFKNRRHAKLATDLEEFCAALPRDAKIPDPCILVDGRWVRQNPPTDPAP